MTDEDSKLLKLGMWWMPKRSGVPNEASASVVPRREQSLPLSN